MSNLVKKSNGFPTTSVFPNFPAFFDDFFRRDLFDWNDKNFAEIGATLPSVNLKETDKEYHIELAVPGMKKDDFKIELENNVLTISSEKQEEKEEKGKDGNFLRKEFNYQSFYRSFTMPENTKEDSIVAKYNDGILNVSIGKKEPKKESKPKVISIK
ncbi:MAG: Hsp20/alpha crystallin family protein [Saprospiraceae bacterium]|nr:Hsp20/alpha crystallin family protein [Saprospiraceae bacterium]